MSAAKTPIVGAVNLKVDGAIAHLELDRPEKRNAMSPDMEHQLRANLDELASNPKVRVIVLTGAGESFCAGHDMAEIEGRSSAPSAGLPANLRRGQLALGEWHAVLRAQPQPIIAAVQGHCVNYGLELAMNCDIVIASEDSQFLSRPLGGMRAYTHLWPWLVGSRKAREFIFSRKAIAGAVAAEHGMVNQVVPREELLSTAFELAQTIAATPLEFLALEKQALNRCEDALGMKVGISSSADLAAAAHVSPYAARVREIMGARGWREAIIYLADPDAYEGSVESAR